MFYDCEDDNMLVATSGMQRASIDHHMHHPGTPYPPDHERPRPSGSPMKVSCNIGPCVEDIVRICHARAWNYAAQNTPQTEVLEPPKFEVGRILAEPEE